MLCPKKWDKLVHFVASVMWLLYTFPRGKMSHPPCKIGVIEREKNALPDKRIVMQITQDFGLERL